MEKRELKMVFGRTTSTARTWMNDKMRFGIIAKQPDPYKYYTMQMDGNNPITTTGIEDAKRIITKYYKDVFLDSLNTAEELRLFIACCEDRQKVEQAKKKLFLL